MTFRYVLGKAPLIQQTLDENLTSYSITAFKFLGEVQTVLRLVLMIVLILAVVAFRGPFNVIFGSAIQAGQTICGVLWRTFRSVCDGLYAIAARPLPLAGVYLSEFVTMLRQRGKRHGPDNRKYCCGATTKGQPCKNYTTREDADDDWRCQWHPDTAVGRRPS